ncbi:hypothetical protein RJT34_24396 [Clitoria ternatea]|uniref:Uncharacterized protein n=1 Tax=Clitoria ternatea TaxID=43366 RepID=A0AAN9FMU5_CLITE
MSSLSFRNWSNASYSALMTSSHWTCFLHKTTLPLPMVSHYGSLLLCSGALVLVMAKEIKLLASCIESAPAPVIHIRKVSHAPLLETIAEEEAESYD